MCVHTRFAEVRVNASSQIISQSLSDDDGGECMQCRRGESRRAVCMCSRRASARSIHFNLRALETCDDSSPDSYVRLDSPRGQQRNTRFDPFKYNSLCSFMNALHRAL